MVVDSPKGYPYYGGTVAAPVFREVVRDSLRYLGVPLRYQPKEVVTDNGDTVSVPSVLNLPVKEAEQILKEVGLEAKRIGTGNIVCAQVPVEGVRIKKGSEVLLRLETDTSLNGKRVVPNLKGRSLRDAAEILGNMDLFLDPEGQPFPTGMAYEQNPLPGTRVPAGTRIKVQFRAPPVTIGP